MLVMKLREETIFLAITHALNMNNKCYVGAEMILGNSGMKMFCLALFCFVLIPVLWIVCEAGVISYDCNLLLSMFTPTSTWKEPRASM